MPSHEPVAGAPRARTGLAWERSGFSFAALGGVVLGIAAHRDAPGLLPLSVALLAAGVAIWRHGRTAYRRADVAPAPRALGLLTLAVVLAALAAGAAVLARL
jgi:uncharacterized membrane protein YidH (DUF202 family)